MSRRRVTSVLQEWLAEGKRVVHIGFLSTSYEYTCTLVDKSATRSFRGTASSLPRCIELALLKAEAEIEPAASASGA